MRNNYQEREAERKEGPRYDLNSASLAKFRQAAKEGLSTLDRAQVAAYAKAVEAAVFASQTSWLRGGAEKPIAPSNSASGTYHSRGEDISAAIRAKQKAALSACPGQIRRARTPAQWAAMYAEALEAKRERWQLENGRPYP